MNYAVIRHADGKKSKSKYQGGFKNGKNTSAYNHDYYIHNKEKWKDNQGDFEEELERINQMPDGPEKQAAYKQYEAKKRTAENARKSASLGKETGTNTRKNDYSGKKPSPNRQGPKEETEEGKKNRRKALAIKKSTQTTAKTGNDKKSMMSPKEKEAIINERKQLGKKKKYSIIDRLMGQPEKDNLKRAQEDYDKKSAMKEKFGANAGYRVQTHTETEKQKKAYNDINTKRRTGEARAKNKLKEAQKAYDKTLSAKIEKGKAWLDKIFKDGRRK
jgi:hypothetical protein